MSSSNLVTDYTKVLLFDVIPSELERLVGEGAYALSAKLASTAVIKLLNSTGFINGSVEEIMKNVLRDIVLGVERVGNELVVHTKVNTTNKAQEGALAGLFVGLLRAMGYKAIAIKKNLPYKGLVTVRVEGNKVIISFPSNPH